MVALSGAIMIGAAALCFGGSLVSRRPLAIAAALIMFASMIDIAIAGAFLPILWTGMLSLGGILLGLDLRRSEGVSQRRRCGPTEAPAFDPLHRGTMVAATLAYPATAWLVVAHAHHDAAKESMAQPGHAHGASGILEVLPPFAIGCLATVLAALAILSFRKRRWVMGAEAGAMSTMLASMLLPPLMAI